MEQLPDFAVLQPTSIDEAVLMLRERRNARPFGGGTGLMPAIRRGLTTPETLVDLSAIGPLRCIRHDDDGLHIGSAVTLTDVAADQTIAQDHPILVQAVMTIAAPAHRSAATVGGNLCLDTRCIFYDQSEWWRRSAGYCLKHRGETCHVAPTGQRCHAAFSADMPPALMALGAAVEIAGGDLARRIPLADLYVDDGAAHLDLAADEIVVAVRIPPPIPGAIGAYRKIGGRGAIDFPLAGVAVLLRMKDEALASLRVALTGTGCRPIVLSGTEDLVGGPVDDDLLRRLGKLVQKQVSPMRTTLIASNYRRQAAAALAQRMVRDLATARG